MGLPAIGFAQSPSKSTMASVKKGNLANEQLKTDTLVVNVNNPVDPGLTGGRLMSASADPSLARVTVSNNSVYITPLKSGPVVVNFVYSDKTIQKTYYAKASAVK